MTQEEQGGDECIWKRRQEQQGNDAFLDVKKNLGSMDPTLGENTLHRKLMLFVSPAEAGCLM